jgi:hypothetical protein
MGQSQRYKELQLPQLRGFCLAATEGSFTSAAKALGLSNSTIWQRVPRPEGFAAFPCATPTVAHESLRCAGP